MFIKIKNRAVLGVGAVVLAAGLVACDEGSAAVAPDLQEVQENAVLDAMVEAIQDEYKAELIYARVMEDFGPVRPFSNIINAEVRHSESLASLFVTRGLPVPESQWAVDQIPGFSTLTEACSAAVTAEIENAEIYDRYMDLDLPADVRFVFENNRRASIENHLRAFQRCS